jgi:hypothetical protein
MRTYRYMSPAARDARAEGRRAAAEADGIPLRDDADCRSPIELDLSHVGGRRYILEPRRGYLSWRVRDAESGQVLHCAALKQALHWIADEMPRMMSARHCL